MDSVFFYGLFMDPQLLREHGLEPRVEGVAELPGHALRIGEKAVLVATPESSAWGLVMRMTHSELERLYSGAGVEQYRPEPVTVVMAADGSTRECSCYNLPAEELGESVNVDYADKLAALATRLSLPAEYVREIRANGGLE